VTQAPAFWSEIWDFCDSSARAAIASSRPGPHDRDAVLPDATLNFAENLAARRDASPAIIAATEATADRVLSHQELHDAVMSAAGALQAAGVVSRRPRGRRDGRTCPKRSSRRWARPRSERLGQSCSPDFGVQGILDRFGQIEPTVLVSVDGYHYGGKTFDCLPKIVEVVRRLPSFGRLCWYHSSAGIDHRTSRMASGGTTGSLRRHPRPRLCSCRSHIRSTSCIHQARTGRAEVHRARRRAARCCSISRNISCNVTSSRTIAFSTSRRAVG
jgi:hypothetical protein